MNLERPPSPTVLSARSHASCGPLVVVLLAAVCVAGAPSRGAGQAPPPDTASADTARRIERVVIRGARAPATVGGASAVVARPDSLATTPAPLLGEVLRATPFILVRQNSRGETELSVRGSDSRQAAVLLDGVPLTLGWDNRSDPSVVPVSGVQSLVLVRGISSLLQGPNVLGGVVDLGVGRSAAGDPPRREGWAGAGVDQYGARSMSLGGALPILSAPGRSLTVRAGGGYRERDGFRVTADAGDTTANDDLRTNSDLRHVDGFVSLRWQGAMGRFAGLTATGYTAERGVPPELHLQEPRRWRYPHQSRVFAALSAGTGVMQTPFGIGSLEATGGYNTGELEIESYTDLRYATVDGRELGDERTATARIAGTHTLPAGGELRAALTAGEVRYQETLDDAVPSDYRQRLWSTGLEAQWPVTAAATISGGMVYDAATTPETGGKEPLARMDGWGWRAAATVAATDAVRLHASTSQRSRFPALRELYSGALATFRPNPNLSPERLTAAELGATLGDGGTIDVGAGSLTLQAVAFHHRLEDAVVRTTVPNTGLFIRVNRDEIRSTGAELLGTWHSAAAGGRAVSLTGDLLLQRVRVHDDSSSAERRPEHQPEVRGSLELGAPLPASLRGAAGVRYTGTQYCAHPDVGAQVRLDGQAEGSLSLERSWPIARGVFSTLRTVLALDNVTDATVYDQCGLPQPGRTLRVSVQLR